MLYEWHEEKNQKNLRKHGVSFKEAQTVFEDPHLIISEDDGSWDEQRFRAIGWSKQERRLMVVYCERSKEEDVEVIRIISARKLTPREKRDLERIR